MACCLLAAEGWLASATSLTRVGDIDRLAADRDVEGVGHRVGNQVVDHRGQALGGVADMLDLGGDAFLGASRRRSARSAFRCGRG